MSHQEQQQQPEDHHHEYKSFAAADTVLSDLWDEFWFFQNCLNDGRPKVPLPSFRPPTTPPGAKGTSNNCGGAATSSALSRHPLTRHQSLAAPATPTRQGLLRAPSLPPDIGKLQLRDEDQDKAAASDSNKPTKKKLQRSRSSMQDAVPCPQPSSACKVTLPIPTEDGSHKPRQTVPKHPIIVPSPSVPTHLPHLPIPHPSQGHASSGERPDGFSPLPPFQACPTPPPYPHRPPRSFQLEAHWVAPNKAIYRHHCPCPTTATATAPGRSRVTLQVKKWKSLTDLEHEEVQGFRDLGFVFDNTHGQLSPVLLKMIPGLRGGTSSSGSGSSLEDRDAAVAVRGSAPKDEDHEEEAGVSRPYLSEAWLMQRSAPPVLAWDGRSPAHMKEKLRFWARAVASNVRQEC